MYSYEQLKKKVIEELLKNKPENSEKSSYQKEVIEQKINRIWDFLKIKEFEKDFLNAKQEVFDENDFFFLYELIDKHVDNPIWDYFIKNRRCVGQVLLIKNGKQYNAFDEIKYVVDGLTDLYRKIEKSLGRKTLFLYQLYKATDYRKIQLKHKLLTAIDENIPNQNEFIKDQYDSESHFIYDSIFEDIEWEIKGVITHNVIQKEDLLKQTKEFDLYLKAGNSGIQNPPLSIMSDQDLQELESKLFKKISDPYIGDKNQKKNLKEIIYEINFKAEIQDTGMTYEEMLKNRSSSTYKQFNALYSNQSKIWTQLYDFFEIKKYIGPHEKNQEWLFDANIISHVSKIMLLFTSKEYKDVRKILFREDGSLIELYLKYGSNIIRTTKMCLECFGYILLEQLSNEKVFEAWEDMYRRVRYRELYILHYVMTILGIEVHPNGPLIHTSDIDSLEEAQKKFPELKDEELSPIEFFIDSLI